MSAAAKVLDRLELVRQTGSGRWIARCPAHPDKSPSLSVREVGDRTLIHCFAQCEVGDVLGALGLELRDLFDHPSEHGKPASHSRIPARDILAAVDLDLLCACMILDGIVARRAASPADVEALAQIAGRIGRARDHAHGR
jgi:hypothetical protein